MLAHIILCRCIGIAVKVLKQTFVLNQERRVCAYSQNALAQRPTLSWVLISLVVNQVGHATAVVQPLLMLESLERLAGAVGLLGWHAALICIQG